ncbi:MAG: hypothetical protein ACI81R_003447 [Bradymonadia bacterium]|jgi:hypothetical protein
MRVAVVACFALMCLANGNARSRSADVVGPSQDARADSLEDTVDADLEELDGLSDAGADIAEPDSIVDVAEPEDAHSDDALDANDVDVDGSQDTSDAHALRFFPADSIPCLCANPLERCDGRRCHRDIGRECDGDDFCPDGYSCSVFSPRICRPDEPLESHQYCPGDDFPDRVCPPATVCDFAGVMCVEAEYSCRGTHACGADEICFQCEDDIGVGEADPHGATEDETARLCVGRDTDSSPRCVPQNSVRAMQGWWPTPADSFCRSSDDCASGQFCEIEDRRVNESVRGWGVCRVGGVCSGGFVGYLWPSPDGEAAGCLQPGAPCEFATECGEGLGCLPPPTLERTGSHICGYYILLADGTTWLPTPASATAMRPTLDD